MICRSCDWRGTWEDLNVTYSMKTHECTYTCPECDSNNVQEDDE